MLWAYSLRCEPRRKGMADLSEQIAAAAAQPAKASNDMGSFEQHPLPDQIAAAEFLKQQAAGAASKKKLPIRFAKIIPPGTV